MSAHRPAQRLGSGATRSGPRITLLRPRRRRLGVARGRKLAPLFPPSPALEEVKEMSKPAEEQQPVKEAKREDDDVEKRFPKPHFEPLPEIAVDKSILLQGFGWDSCEHDGGGAWYKNMQQQVEDIQEAGFTHVWLPPPSHSVARQGYLPDELYDLETPYGGKDDLVALNQALRAAGIRPMADIVANHRSAAMRGEDGKWNQYTDRVEHPGAKLDWGAWAITGDDPEFGGTGSSDTGDDYNPAPDVDHSNEQVRQGYVDWLNWLHHWVGFSSWRFDYVKGYAARFVSEYVLESVGEGELNVGEYWVDMEWHGSTLAYDQDAARQRLCDWMDEAGGGVALFDFCTKGIMQEAVRDCEYDRLQGADGKPPGLLGWWPARAVTFVDNHDTGGSQCHWPFPQDRLDQGYAYILTHPGVPCVLHEHYTQPELHGNIKELVRLRRRSGVHASSAVRIAAAEKDMYVAYIDDRLVLKLGPRYDMGACLPCKEDGWAFAASGKDWAVWERREKGWKGDGRQQQEEPAPLAEGGGE